LFFAKINMDENDMKNELNKDSIGEEGYNDTVNKTSSNLTKIIMPFILVLVLSIVIYTTYSFLLSNDSQQNKSNKIKEETVFDNEEDDPFFIDSPADALDKLQKEQESKANNKNDEINADELFDKEMLLDEKKNHKDNSFSALEPASTTTLSPATVKEIIPAEKKSQILAPAQNVVTEETKYQTTKNLKSKDSLELFIQTGTFLKYKPNAKFLNNIQELGLSYKIDIYIRNQQSITRVLVGPFKTKSEANEALLSIREKIAKDAFILKTRLH